MGIWVESGSGGRRTGPLAGSGSGEEAYGGMGRVRKRWGGIQGYGQGQAVVGRHTGIWAESGSARGRHTGHGQGQAVVGRHTGPWAGSGSGEDAYKVMGRIEQWWGDIRGDGQG